MRIAIGWWAALVVASVGFGWPLRRAAKLGAPPLAGGYAVPTVVLVPLVLAFGVALARRLPLWSAAWPWRRLLVGAALLGLLWGVAVASLRGPSGVERGLRSHQEYPAVVDDVERIGIGSFIGSFTDPEVLAGYPIHIQGHPLGAALLFVGLDRVGLGGALGAALVLLVAGATTTPAVLLATREVAGEVAARRAAPFLVLAPAVIWTVTSADALYSAIGAWSVAAAIAATSPDRSRAGRLALGLVGGLLFGVGIHLSYGLAVLAVVPVGVVVHRRRWEPVVAGVIGVAAVTATSIAVGFWWLDGLAATRVRYWAGVASQRPFAYFALLGNPGATALATGPALAVAIATVRDRRLWLLAGGGLAAMVLADLSGMSKAEVERIWLPFVPWALVLTAGLAAHLQRVLLISQVLVTVLIESVIRTLW